MIPQAFTGSRRLVLYRLCHQNTPFPSTPVHTILPLTPCMGRNTHHEIPVLPPWSVRLVDVPPHHSSHSRASLSMRVACPVESHCNRFMPSSTEAPSFALAGTWQDRLRRQTDVLPKRRLDAECCTSLASCPQPPEGPHKPSSKSAESPWKTRNLKL